MGIKLKALGIASVTFLLLLAGIVGVTAIIILAAMIASIIITYIVSVVPFLTSQLLSNSLVLLFIGVGLFFAGYLFYDMYKFALTQLKEEK